MSNKIKHKHSVPYIRQLERSECGITCLSMILSYYHHETNLFRLREHVSGGRNGINLLTLKKISISFHLDSQGKKAEAEALKLLPLPVICYWDNNHYVVLEKVGKNDIFSIVDPSIGKTKLSLEEFKEKYSGYVLTAIPTDGFTQKKKDRAIFWSFLRPFFQEKKILFSIVLFAFLLQLTSIGVPLFTKYLVDKITLTQETHLLQIAGLAMLATVVLQIAFRYIHGYLLIILQNILDRKLLRRFTNHLFSLPLKFFEARSNGDLVMRSHNMEVLRELVVNHLVSTVINILVLVGLFMFMLSQSVLLTISLLVVGLFQVLFTLATRKKIKNLTSKEITSVAALRGYLTESIHGISIIKNLGFEDHIVHKWGNLFETKLTNTYKTGKAKLSVDSVLQTVNLLVPSLIIWIGIYQLIQGEITIGTLFAFQSLSISFLTPISALATSIVTLTQMESLMELILDVQETSKEDTEGKNISSLQGNIKLENVSFQFDPYSPPVLKNINLDLPAGKKIAVIGESGSGKSTLAALLTGLYEPTSGSLYYDQYDIKELDKKALRKQLGIVTQNHVLFNQTIRENIALSNPDLPYSEVIHAAIMAEIHEDILKTPLQYETVISENGTNLSGGQKQRLSLARALIHKPRILILDEATSALDTVTERKVDENISKMDCTRIVIAHRLDTIINSDIIIIMREGEVVASGTPQELQINHEYIRFFREKENKNLVSV